MARPAGCDPKANMTVTPDGQTLVVRGYIGISLLGKNQYWTRRLEQCPLAPESQQPFYRGECPLRATIDSGSRRPGRAGHAAMLMLGMS
jgi:hypothetical protein